MKLSVVIPTHLPTGIQSIEKMNLPVVEDVEYVVSWQNHQNAAIPDSLSTRKDIRIFRIDEPGVSRNRNNALAHARGDILLMGDDDLIYTPKQLQQVICTFKEHPDTDFAVFQAQSPDQKLYPKEECDLTRLPKCFWVTTFELAWRKNTRTARLKFDTNFGPGSHYLAGGEDEMLFLMARRIGLSCRFFPVTITTHPGLTTGFRTERSRAVNRAQGAVMAYTFPVTCLPRIIKKAIGLPHHRLKSLAGMMWGMFYAAFCIRPEWNKKTKK